MGESAHGHEPTAHGAAHGWAGPGRERWGTTPNAITAVRTALALVLAGWAWSTTSTWLIVIGYGVYWLGDILDGYAARRLDQETRRGAVADIVCDRICTVSLGVALAVTMPWTIVPIAVFFIQFTVVDLVLSLHFLRWPLLSPNYFYLVDNALYQWNWSPLAKVLNTSSVILVTALTGSGTWGGLVAGAGLCVKVVSLVSMRRLTLGCRVGATAAAAR